MTTVARSAVLRIFGQPVPDDPYAYFAVLREIAPVYLADFGTMTICLASSHAACAEVLSSPDFGVHDVGWLDVNYPGWRDHPAALILYQGVQSRNPPEHTRIRRVLGGCFSPRRLSRLSERVSDLADQYADAIADSGADGGVVDLMSEFAAPIPVTVISELLGVPEGDRSSFHQIGGQIFNLMDLFISDEDRCLADEATVKLRDYWIELVRERRRAPKADLTCELIAAADAGQLTEDELLSTLIFLFAAGYGSTEALIGNAAYAMLTVPGLAARLRQDESIAPALVEESLRYEAPTQIDARRTMREVTLGGVRLDPGTFVIALLGAANRDPDMFPDPDTFDVDRPERHVLTFGGGIHYCLGAPLSRMEAAIVLPRLARRFPRLALAAEPVRRPAARMRMFSRLPLTVS